MYSETELRSAIEAGVVDEGAVARLRAHIAAQRETPSADDESFRLLTGFNDVFVAIAATIMLVAVAWLGGSVGPGLGAGLVAATAWGLAEYFTRRRRMALPSIILLVAFAGGVAAAVGSAVDALVPSPARDDGWFLLSVSLPAALVTAGAVWLHWRRFMVPITVAVGALAVAMAVNSAILYLLSRIALDEAVGRSTLLPLMATLTGVAVFALAMRWDRSDPTRVTRRSDVAFWLHLLAAPLIAHGLFSLLGLTAGEAPSVPGALLVIALYLLFGIVALAIDRRALLVSALVYVLAALTGIVGAFGVVEQGTAVTALVIGSALLLLSAFWQRARQWVVARLPRALAAGLPAAAPSAPGVGAA